MRLIGFVFVSALALAACGGKSKPADQPAPAATLYERLGGAPAIEVVIDKFLANVVADTRINSFFSHLDADGVARVRGHLIDQVCNATGGGCEYKGRSMKEAHTGMNLTDAHFDALVEDLVKALDEAGVKPADKDELLGALGGMRGDIVGQ